MLDCNQVTKQLIGQAKTAGELMFGLTGLRTWTKSSETEVTLRTLSFFYLQM